MEASKRFMRDDGRTDRDILWAMLESCEPGQIYEMEALQEILAEGLDGDYVPKHKVYHAVRMVNDDLLPMRKRVLRSVRGKGYMVARAHEHAVLAQQRERRAKRQVEHAYNVVTHVKEGELTPEQLKIHNATLILVANLYGMICDGQKKQERAESLIDQLLKRVDRLESKVGDDS